MIGLGLRPITFTHYIILANESYACSHQTSKFHHQTLFKIKTLYICNLSALVLFSALPPYKLNYAKLRKVTISKQSLVVKLACLMKTYYKAYYKM